MADATTTEQTTEQTTTQQTSQTNTADLISRAEAKKAFEARDKAKKEADELRSRLAALEQAQQERDAKAEEDRLKAAGQWDSLRQSLVEKQTKELADRDAKYQAERNKRLQRSVDAAFGGLTSGANDFFSGNDGSKTVWDVWTAQRALGSYVQVEDTEDGHEIVVVKDIKGQTILGADGNPAPFAAAIGELIAMLPNKNLILRGSGKTGSGSSGGSTGGRHEIDFRNLTPEQRRDPKVLAQLRASLPRGSVIMGEAYN